MSRPTFDAYAKQRAERDRVLADIRRAIADKRYDVAAVLKSAFKDIIERKLPTVEEQNREPDSGLGTDWSMLERPRMKDWLEG